MRLEKPHLENASPEAKDWTQLIDGETPYQDYEFPKVSIVIPTFNCMHSISSTLTSVLTQHYPDFEVLIVDGGSTDRTLEVVQSFRDERLKIFTISGFHRYAMMNKGISQATGKYINFLFPSDFYISRTTLQSMMTLALNTKQPQLVYCGTLMRDGVREVKILYRPLTINMLKRGQQPTSLQSCWFRIDTFEVLGKFNTAYLLRGGFDLLCRFCLHSDLRSISIYRVLTDYDLRWVTRKDIFTHFSETMKIVYKHFGLLASVALLRHQRDAIRYLKLWAKKVGVAFWKR